MQGIPVPTVCLSGLSKLVEGSGTGIVFKHTEVCTELHEVSRTRMECIPTASMCKVQLPQ